MSNSLKKMSNLNNKLSNNINNTINNATKSYNKVINKNESVSYVIIALLIVLIVCIQFIPTNVLAFLNNSVVRLILITLICLLCLVDPVKALLCAIAFVVAIQKYIVSMKNQTMLQILMSTYYLMNQIQSIIQM